MHKFILILLMIVGLGSGFVYFQYGALSPCKILKQKVEQVFMEEIMSKISNESGSTLARIVAAKLTHKIIKTMNQAQCIEVFFNVEEMKKIYSLRTELHN